MCTTLLICACDWRANAQAFYLIGIFEFLGLGLFVSIATERKGKEGTYQIKFNQYDPFLFHFIFLSLNVLFCK